jgi:hypothetical protein
MEMTSILMSNFTTVQHICSQSPNATMIPYLAGFVHSCVRMLLTPGPSNGARSLVRSMDLIRAKYPYDDSSHVVKPLAEIAQKAAADLLPLDHTWIEGGHSS